MPKSKAEIDQINVLRTQMGEALLPYEDEDTVAAAKAAADAAAAEEEAKRKAATVEAAGTEKEPVIKLGVKGATVENTEGKPNAGAGNEDDIDDDKLKKALAKKLGIAVEDVDAYLKPKETVLTDDDKIKLKEERENKKIAFALQSGKITKKEIDSYVADTNDLEKVVYNHYKAQQLEIDPDLTVEEIEAAFEEKYGLTYDKESRQFKAGQKDLSFIAESIIKQKHANYLSIDNEFNAHEESEATAQKTIQEISAKTPQFRKDIDDVKAELKTLKINLANNESYSIQLDDELLDSYTQKMLTPEYAKKVISQGYTKDGIRDTIKFAVIADNLDSIIQGVVNADRLKNQAGLRGVLPERKFLREKELTEEAKKNKEKLRETLGMTQASAN